jgi:maltose/moltooligosaccharide transporter
MDGCWFTVDIRRRNNTAMEPYRAFIADKLDDRHIWVSNAKFFTGFSKHTLVYLFFLMIFIGKTGSCLPGYMLLSS